MTETAKDVCGTVTEVINKKQTTWWTNEVKLAMKEKKVAWLKYLKDQTEEAYEIHKTNKDNGPSNTWQTVKIGIEQIELEQVNQIKYLGSWITEDGKVEAQLDDRVPATTKLYFSLNRQIFNKKKLYTRTKTRMFNVLYVSARKRGRLVRTREQEHRQAR
ncbi:hypothetical protein ILUMI_22985 [Ignelater luminosus]|uniref:Uncharacterized protein n=1 Tax=Ignelater luminosus TaxID=2038154 RepID=A0A8K0FX51_IGNLU|nr:hypothetical protein ILUMI_22985 [Ignelater luminosus]